MDPEDFPTLDAEVETVSPTALKQRIDAGESVTLLDTRMASEHEAWHIDGPAVNTLNVPYFEFLKEDVDDAVLDQLPADEHLTVICAKGGASEYVAGTLADMGYDVSHVADGMNGWASIYEAVEVTEYSGAGTLWQYQRPSSGCLTYLLAADGEAAVIDPLRAFTDRYLADADSQGLDLVAALDTHIHADHLSGVRALADAGVTGIIPAPAVERGVSDAERFRTVSHGDTVSVGDATIEVIATPGHTSGMTAYLLDGEFLATGDGLFVESVARPDLEAGDEGAPAAARELHQSLQERILSLPDETLVGGAHYSDAASPADDGTYTATVGTLERRMPALSLDESAFVDLVLADMPPRPANYGDIIAANLGQEPVADDEAFRLELGPNNCAASQGSLADD